MNKHDKINNNFECNLCDYKCCKTSHWNDHLNTLKHKKRLKNDVSTNYSVSNFDCSFCDVKCSHISIYNRHIKTKKHRNAINSTNFSGRPYEILENNQYFDIFNKLIVENQELRNFVVEQSKDFMKLMVEQNSKILETVATTNNNTNSITINGNVNNNNRFNINVFLNEKCKDAINFTHFIDNIEVSHEDLENNAQLGFVDGISKILLDNLKQLSVYERPIHCTDIKRETMYIKDQDKWNKEENHTKINGAIQKITGKSIRTLNNWKDETPEYQDIDSEFSKKYICISQQSMAGYNRDKYYPKVVSQLAKTTVLDKTNLIE